MRRRGSFPVTSATLPLRRVANKLDLVSYLWPTLFERHRPETYTFPLPEHQHGFPRGDLESWLGCTVAQMPDRAEGQKSSVIPNGTGSGLMHGLWRHGR